MRDGEEVLRRVRAEVRALRVRAMTEGGAARFLAWAGKEEYLEALEPLAYLPEPHPPPPVIECDECRGKGFVWGNVQEPVKIDCADCNGLGYLYDPCFHCGHHDPKRDPAVSCFYCETWPLGPPPEYVEGENEPIAKYMERFQFLGSLAESEDDVPY